MMQRLTELPQNIQDALKVADSASGLECPECLGGDSKERSLSVARRGMNVVFQCWRNSCGYRGGAIAGSALAATERTKFRPRPITQPLWKLSRIEADLLYVKYRLQRATLDTCGVRTVGNNQGQYLPVYGPNKQLRGGVVRDDTGAGPKAMSYKTADGVWQAWYLPDEWQIDEPVVIVEDQYSAMRLYQLGYKAVALIGTALTPAKLAEIATVARTAILALDNDAYATAVKYARTYAGEFHIIPLYLQRDIKDCSNAKIIKLLEVVDV